MAPALEDSGIKIVTLAPAFMVSGSQIVPLSPPLLVIDIKTLSLSPALVVSGSNKFLLPPSIGVQMTLTLEKSLSHTIASPCHCVLLEPTTVHTVGPGDHSPQQCGLNALLRTLASTFFLKTRHRSVGPQNIV